jgi:hypothetical protein
VDEGIPDGYYRSELADARYCGMSTESTYILWGIYIVSAFVTTKICIRIPKTTLDLEKISITAGYL